MMSLLVTTSVAALVCMPAAGLTHFSQHASHRGADRLRHCPLDDTPILCDRNGVSVLEHVSQRKLRFGSECATQSKINCVATPASPGCSLRCGDCPCEFDPSGDLHSQSGQMMFEQLSSWCNPEAMEKNETSRVLMIGLGGAALPQYLLHHCPHMSIEAAEISSTVIGMARDYFGLAKSEDTFGSRISIDHANALEAIESRSGDYYDAVVVDCFVGGGEVPEDCRSQRYAQGVLRLLRPGGQLLQNMWDKSPERPQVAREYSDTMLMYPQVFGEGAVTDVGVTKGWVHIIKAVKKLA